MYPFQLTFFMKLKSIQNSKKEIGPDLLVAYSSFLMTGHWTESGSGHSHPCKENTEHTENQNFLGLQRVKVTEQAGTSESGRQWAWSHAACCTPTELEVTRRDHQQKQYWQHPDVLPEADRGRAQESASGGCRLREAPMLPWLYLHPSSRGHDSGKSSS